MIWHAGAPVHEALAPSAHWEKLVHPPGITQSVRPSETKTEWQSVRASHAGSVVTLAQAVGAGHVVEQPTPPKLAGPQPAKVWPASQVGQ